MAGSPERAAVRVPDAGSPQPARNALVPADRPDYLPRMLVSARGAARILGTVGVHREAARRLLALGFAGEPIRTSSALLYDEARVEALARWPLVTAEEARRHCSSGVFVARRDVDVREPLVDQLAGLRRDWPLAFWKPVGLTMYAERDGYYPFVATVGGFVALGANIVAADLDPSRPGHRPTRVAEPTVLTFEEAGAWFDNFRGHRFPTGPGRAWRILR